MGGGEGVHDVDTTVIHRVRCSIPHAVLHMQNTTYTTQGGKAQPNGRA